ncbi:MAG: hypothetical protein MI862_22000 [Desulfobacterales bacterium]|nr:hypothetical protein [Desulfobacterales bacterium]
MYYLYFPFIVILAALMVYECRTKKHPQWWAAVVFFAPITAPLFIYKIRKESGIILIMIFLAVFSAVGGIEFFLYSRYMEKRTYERLSPVTRHMIDLSNILRQSTIELDNALVKLENLSKVASQISRIKATIDFIGELREIKRANKQAIDDLVEYTGNNKVFFTKKDLEWVFNIKKFYNNRDVVQHYESLIKYLDDFEALLRYTYKNFYNISKHKNPEHLKNYDEYYIRYRRSVDSHNRFNVKRIDFQNRYLTLYPEIKAYLPGERQTETFRLWD